MLRILAVDSDNQVHTGITLEQLEQLDIRWFWVDFASPTEVEARLLETHFHFHYLAVEDCLHLLQRPKLDHFENMQFFVLHAMDQYTLTAKELDLFLLPHGIVTFHFDPLFEVEEVWNKLLNDAQLRERGPVYAIYLLMDKLVDYYFPCVYFLEDELNEIEQNEDELSVDVLTSQVYDIRRKLLKLRRTVFPMRELLYRIVNSQKIEGLEKQLLYFIDVHDHLIKITEIIDQNRDMTSDLRDSYISLNSIRMNRIMKTLTVITTIFMPLTFIAGIYGMNFNYMPELTWAPSYFIVLCGMLGLGIGMFLWFRKKGWFD